jgi:aminopeptidase YwaD
MKAPGILWLIFLFLFFIHFSGTGFSQTNSTDQNKSAIEKRIKEDISMLASDSLIGRETGTYGEIMARDYIISCYKKAGLQPAFKEGSYIQSYTFKDTPVYGDSNFLRIKKRNYTLEKDFYPLVYSASAVVNASLVNVGYGIIVPEKNYNDYLNAESLKGKIFVMNTSVPQEYASDTLFLKYNNLQKKIDTAIAKGATGIIFTNSGKSFESPSMMLGRRIAPSTVPILFVNTKAGKKIKRSIKHKAFIQVDIERKIKTGYNVAAFIDNKAANTIIIGAHYDHLGLGKENSMYQGDKPLIHHGADDNASGTAAVIEIARYIKNSLKKNNNYLFINFSGEEKGLLGSSNFTKSDAFDPSKVNYMLNLDMIGRYDSSKVGLDIIGTGTSPLWDTLIALTPHPGIKIKKTKSGIDGSDQISFYTKDIPVLFFFTGIHSDYHKPADDAEKINFKDEVAIIQYAEKLIERTDSLAKIPFSKTNDASSMKRSSFKVTLGVVPDHSFDGKGMRIEAVLDDRPAKKAGMLSGDIVLKIGQNDVNEIMSYMKALGMYKKGDKANVTIKRGEEILIKEVEF